MNEKMYSMKSVAKYLNDRTITDYIFRLSLLAKSVFKWNNLPNGIDEKHIEKYLYTDGMCLKKSQQPLHLALYSADINAGSIRPAQTTGMSTNCLM